MIHVLNILYAKLKLPEQIEKRCTRREKIKNFISKNNNFLQFFFESKIISKNRVNNERNIKEVNI
jgi:hypothetical protein